MPDKVTIRFKVEHADAATRLDGLAVRRGISVHDMARELLLSALRDPEHDRKGDDDEQSDTSELLAELEELKEVVSRLADSIERRPKGLKLATKQVVELREDLATMFTALLVRFAKVERETAGAWVKKNLVQSNRSRNRSGLAG